MCFIKIQNTESKSQFKNNLDNLPVDLSTRLNYTIHAVNENLLSFQILGKTHFQHLSEPKLSIYLQSECSESRRARYRTIALRTYHCSATI